MAKVAIYIFSKQSKELGTSWKQGIPIEVIPSAYRPVQLKLESMLGGQANLRMAVKKCVGFYFLYMIIVFVVIVPFNSILMLFKMCI